MRFKLTGCVQTSVVANTCASQKNPRAKAPRACRVPEELEQSLFAARTAGRGPDGGWIGFVA